jgi:hypothetical protein
MARRKPTISYNTGAVENALQWDVETNIPRSDVGRVCKALLAHTSRVLGSTFYYPNPTTRATTCRYEWFMGKGKKRFVYRVGVMFTVSDEPVRRMKAYVGYGNAHALCGTLPSDDEETTSQLHKLLDVLKSVEAENDARRALHSVSYIQIPHGFYIGRPVQSDSLGAVILPTVLVGRENLGVSALILTTNEAQAEDEDDPIDRNLELCVLLTLATGAMFKIHFVQWQKRQKPKQEVAAIDPLPENVDLFPPKRWKSWDGVGDESFSARLDAITSMFGALDEPKKATVRNAMFAYRSGLEMVHRQPTLASVAFVAALGFLGKREQCPGDVECRVCGRLPNFRHDLTGERQALFTALADIFRLTVGQADWQDLNDLLIRVYREQRSAYVHGAKLRHRELSRRGFRNAQPTATAPFSEEYVRELDLRSMEHLTRRAIVKFMARESKTELDDQVFCFSPFKVMAMMPVNSLISLPANVWVELATNRAAPAASNTRG